MKRHNNTAVDLSLKNRQKTVPILNLDRAFSRHLGSRIFVRC